MKRFAMLVLIFTLLLSAVAEAKFSDGYKAKYPRRVKVETVMNGSGKQVTDVTYKLFKHTIQGHPFQIMLYVSDDIIKICSFSAGHSSNLPESLAEFTWGDGTKEHHIKKSLAFTERRGRNDYFSFLSSDFGAAELEEMKAAVSFSLCGSGGFREPMLYKGHKYWDEFMEAIDAAAKIMSERYTKES